MMKMVNCPVCCQEVSKRSTIAIEEGHRVCRSHQEAKDFQAREEGIRRLARLEEELWDRLEQNWIDEISAYLPDLWAVNRPAFFRAITFIREKKGGKYANEVEAAARAEDVNLLHAIDRLSDRFLKSLGRQVCEQCAGSGMVEIETGDGRSDNEPVKEICASCEGTGEQ